MKECLRAEAGKFNCDVCKAAICEEWFHCMVSHHQYSTKQNIHNKANSLRGANRNVKTMTCVEIAKGWARPVTPTEPATEW